MRSQVSAVSIENLGYKLDSWDSIPGRDNGGIFSLHHHIKTSSSAHPASYPMGTKASCLTVKQ
jgi:hypothetical protein